MSTSNKYKAKLVGIALAAVVAFIAFVGVAHAQSGHFVGDVTCTDQGTTAQCCGKVAGLGGTPTFEIRVAGPEATASVTCTNPAGNIAPGQSFNFEPTGTTGVRPVPRNGQYRFCVDTTAPSAPPGSCPNPKWTATVTDVQFTTATVSLFEGTQLSDELTGLPVE